MVVTFQCFLSVTFVSFTLFVIAKMNYGFASSLTPTAAHALSLDYEQISFVKFIASDDSEDEKLYLVYLHGKRSTEPINTKWSKIQPSFQTETATFDLRPMILVWSP